jgi:hypothetical protein
VRAGRQLLPIIAIVCATLPCFAHDPATTKLTWTREISRIFEKRCVGCHQDGGIAPMPLRTYEQIRPWAVAIKEEVLERRMPPWPAVKGFGEFANDLSLPQEEISRIADWTEGGAPEGDRVYLPPARDVPRWVASQAPRGTPLKAGALQSSVSVLAIMRSSPGRIWAVQPGGQRVPLVWWTQSAPVKLRQPLLLRVPLFLPAGTRVEGGVVELIVSTNPAPPP